MIYWDNNSTTPCDKEVLLSMEDFFSSNFGNPSSSHLMGKKANRAISISRYQVSNFINSEPNEVIFTSGATESNNLLFLAILLSDNKNRKKIVTTAIEHKSVLEPLSLLAKKGFEISFLPITKNGVVDLSKASDIITEDTIIVSVQAVNNEIGTIQPIKEIAEIAHMKGAFFHSDSAQAISKMPFDVLDLDCDFASFSSHKIYGPKGCGALFIKGGIHNWKWEYPFNGGGQEGGLRPGTLNVPAIVGFGMACKIANEKLKENILHLSNLSAYLEDKIIQKIPNSVIHARNAKRIPGTISVAFKNIPADIIVDNLEEIYIGKGSACTNHAINSSHVLEAIGCNADASNSTVRISLSKHSTVEEIDQSFNKLLTSLSAITNKLRGANHVAR